MCGKVVGKSLGSGDACPAPPPRVLSFAVFFMIRDKIMSLSSTPENISLGCIIAVELLCGGGESYNNLSQDTP